LASFTDRLATDPHVSPDGRFVLVGTRSALSVYNVATRRETKLADGAAWDLAWSPKLDRVAWVRGDAEGKGQYVWTMPIDPKTALSSGPPQRVTMGQSDYPSISSDGKWIAFSAPDSETSGTMGGLQPHHLSIVPVTGGPERVLAHFDEGFEGEHWSADSKSLFVPSNPHGLPKASISRIYLDGRAPEIIRQGGPEWFVSTTSDHSHLVVVPARSPVAKGDVAIVLDTAGREIGRAQLPIGTIAEYDVAIDSSLVWVWIQDRHAIEIASAAGSAPRRIRVGESSEFPVWSPDGRRIAFQVHENGHNVVALANSDGSAVQVLHDIVVRPGQPGTRWSPDSKTIGFVNADSHRFVVLDVASKSTRTIVEDTTRRIGNWTWRPDGQSIAAVMIEHQAPPKGTIDEITLTGARRKLYEIAAPYVPRSGFQFVDGRNAYLRADSVAYLIPLGGGVPRRLTSVPVATRAYGTAISRDGRTAASPMLDDLRGELNQVEVISLESGQRRLVPVPFQLTIGSQPMFTDNDRSLLVFGQQAGDTVGTRLYSVPLNGDPPRAVATVERSGGASVTVSPDGKSIAYTVQASRTTSLLLVDLRAIISSAAPRQAGRSPDQ
jgi:Tol biopolymer transport system component